MINDLVFLKNLHGDGAGALTAWVELIRTTLGISFPIPSGKLSANHRNAAVERVRHLSPHSSWSMHELQSLRGSATPLSSIPDNKTLEIRALLPLVVPVSLEPSGSQVSAQGLLAIVTLP